MSRTWPFFFKRPQPQVGVLALHLTHTHRNSLSLTFFWRKCTRTLASDISLSLHTHTHTHSHTLSHTRRLSPSLWHTHTYTAQQGEAKAQEALLHIFLCTLRERRRKHCMIFLSLSLPRARMWWENTERKEPCFIHTSRHTHTHIHTHTYTHINIHTHKHISELREARCVPHVSREHACRGLRVWMCAWRCA